MSSTAAPSPSATPLAIAAMRWRYPNGRVAVDGLTLDVNPGEIVALLGPNGSGKSTTFRVLSTLAPIQDGSVRVFGRDLATEADAVRRLIGVVFQAPSLDKKLTVEENVLLQGAFYGLRGADLKRRAKDMLERFGLLDRARERVEKLSGGLKRRVELAKGMLHEPRLLLLDEPSTGLDPAARRAMWDALEQQRTRHGVAALVTTHFMEEAERCDRVALLDEGKLVALDTPDALKASVGGDVITIRPRGDLDALAAAVREKFGEEARAVDGALRVELREGHRFIPRLVEAFPGEIEMVSLGKPTLEDVFIAKTGHKFETGEEAGG